MKKRHCLDVRHYPFLAALGCLLILVPCAQAEMTAGVPFAHEQSDLAPDPKAVFGTLTNGLRYVFYPGTEPPGRLFAYLRIDAGSAYETEAQQGIAHFLEHMAFNGSENFAPGELIKYFQGIGMSFGGDVNAFTSLDQTAYSLDLPDATPDTLEDAFKLLGDYARRLSLLSEEIDRERGVILAEMRDRDSVNWRIHKAMIRFVYDDVTLSRRMPIGLKRTVSAMQKPLFDDFYNTWYRPERMTLIVTGDAPFETLRPYIEKGFSSLAAGVPVRDVPAFGEYEHEGTKAFAFSDEEAESTRVEVAVAVREDRPKDTAKRRRHEAARDLGEMVVRRRLQKLARLDDAVFTRGSAYSYNAFGWSHYAGLELRGKPERWRDMLEMAEQTLRAALLHGFTKVEIAEAKAVTLRSIDEAVMKADTRNSRDLARGILGAIAQDRVVMSPAGRRDLLKPFIAELDGDAIHAAFRDAWKAEHRLVMVTGNAATTEEEILATFATSQQVAVDPPVETEEVAFAYATPPATAGVIAARRHIEDLEIEQVTFGNGVRLNLKPTEFKKNEIQIRLRFGGGTRAMPGDKEGLDQLATMIMIEGGLGKHSREELKSALAGRTAHVGFAVSGNHMVFSGSTIPEDLELTLQLIRAYVTDAAYRPEAMRLAGKRYAEQYARMIRTPGGVRSLKVTRLLARGDRRFGMPSLAVFNQRTAGEVQAWVASEKRLGGLELSIAGDIDVARTIELAALYIGTLPVEKAGRLAPVKPVHFMEPGAHTLTVPTKIDRSELGLYWKTTDAFSDIRRTRRLGMLAKVFSEYLREEVREKLGGAYSPWSRSQMSDAYDGYGSLMARVKVAPDAAESTRDAVLKIAQTLSTEGTTDELFGRVQGPTLNGIKKYRRTNGYWMQVIDGSLARPEQLDWARSFVGDFEAMTVEELNKLAATYLAPDKARIMLIEPAGDVAPQPDGAP